MNAKSINQLLVVFLRNISPYCIDDNLPVNFELGFLGGQMRLVGSMTLALGIAVAALPVAAQDYNRGYSVEEYAKLAASHPGKGMNWNIHNYLYGLTAGLRAAKAEYDKAGAAPLYCVPVDRLSIYQGDYMNEDPAKSGDPLKNRGLYDFLAEELAANGHAWRRDSTATIGTLALYVVRRKFPC